MKARMKADATDRSKIRQQLQEPIDPLHSSSHSDVNIVKIVSDRIATDPTVDVHEAVSIGTEMTKHCEITLPIQSACSENHKETHRSRTSRDVRCFFFDIFPIWGRRITPPPFWSSYLSTSTLFPLPCSHYYIVVTVALHIA